VKLSTGPLSKKANGPVKYRTPGNPMRDLLLSDVASDISNRRLDHDFQLTALHISTPAAATTKLEGTVDPCDFLHDRNTIKPSASPGKTSGSSRVTLNTRPFSPRLFPAIVCKHDVVQKTGNTRCIATLPKKDRAMAIGDMHENVVKIGRMDVYPETSSRTDAQTGGQTNEQTYISNLSQYFAPLPETFNQCSIKRVQKLKKTLSNVFAF